MTRPRGGRSSRPTPSCAPTSTVRRWGPETAVDRCPSGRARASPGSAYKPGSELPASVQTADFCGGDLDGPAADPHGTAVAEVIHDMARARTYDRNNAVWSGDTATTGPSERLLSRALGSWFSGF